LANTPFHALFHTLSFQCSSPEESLETITRVLGPITDEIWPGIETSEVYGKHEEKLKKRSPSRLKFVLSMIVDPDVSFIILYTVKNHTYNLIQVVIFSLLIPIYRMSNSLVYGLYYVLSVYISTISHLTGLGCDYVLAGIQP